MPFAYAKGIFDLDRKNLNHFYTGFEEISLLYIR